MKKIIISILIVLLLVGCSNKTNEEKIPDYNPGDTLPSPYDDPNREHIVNIKLDYNSNDVLSLIGKIIKENVYKDFDINDYVVESSKSESVDENGNEEATYIYDYVFTLGGAKTNIAYTVFVENNVVTKIYDNMQGYDAKEIKNSKKAKKIESKIKELTESKKEKIRAAALKNDSKRKITSEEVRYDIKNDYLYYSIQVLVTEKSEDFNSYWVDIYEEEI